MLPCKCVTFDIPVIAGQLVLAAVAVPDLVAPMPHVHARVVQTTELFRPATEKSRNLSIKTVINFTSFLPRPPVRASGFVRAVSTIDFTVTFLAPGEAFAGSFTAKLIFPDAAWTIRFI